MRRLRNTRGAGRTGGTLNTASVEQHEECIALASGEGEVRVTGKAPLRSRIAGEDGIGNLASYSVNESVTEGAHASDGVKTSLVGRR